MTDEEALDAAAMGPERGLSVPNEIVWRAVAIARHRGKALREIATPRPYVDMADPEADQQRDALTALVRLHDVARKALEEVW